MTTAIRLHHNLNPEQVDDLAFILHAADNLTKLDGNGNSGGGTFRAFDEHVADFLALEENDIKDILVEVNESVEQISAEVFNAS